MVHRDISPSRRRCAKYLAVALFLLMVMVRDARGATPDDSQLKQWGGQTLEMMDRDFPRAPDLWAAGVRLSALVAASRVDGKHLQEAKDYSRWIQEHFGDPKALLAGLTAPPDSPNADRYYDDNAWIVLDLIELYGLSRDPRDLEQARQLYEFVLSGQDDALGGGIWWRMQAHETKNTCTNAPAIVAGLRLYQLCGDEKCLANSRRLYAWVNSHLLDDGGLYFDHVRRDGSVDKTKWSYNTALMIRANLLLATIDREPKYLADAQRLARASVAKWVRDDGVITDDGAFAHLLCGALLKLHEADHDPHWREVVLNALNVLHNRCRDPLGHYAKRWDQFPTGALRDPPFIAQASAARAYWEAIEPANPK